MNENYVMIFIKTVYPYYKEINNILAYPNGFTFRVRYREEWVKLQDHERTKQPNGLILLQSADSLKVVPLRKVIISEIVKIGTLTFISLELGDIIEFSSDPHKRSGQFDRFQITLDRITTQRSGVFPVAKSEELTAELVDQDFTGEQGDRILNSWGNLIEILGQFPCYQNFDFIKFISLSHETGEPINPQENPSGLEYPLIPGKGYSLSVLQVIPRSGIVMARDHQGKINYPERENKWLEIQSPSPDIILLANRLPITSRYDIYTFRFNIREIMSEKISAIRVSINTKTETADRTDCEIVLPVRLHLKTTWHLWRILNIVVFVISGLTLLIPEFLESIVPFMPITSANGGLTLIQKSAIVLLVLTSWSFPRAEKWLGRIMGV